MVKNTFRNSTTSELSHVVPSMCFIGTESYLTSINMPRPEYMKLILSIRVFLSRVATYTF